MRILSVVVLLTTLSAVASAQEAPVATLGNGRTGKIYFESATPAGYFALARSRALEKAVIFGTLQLPKRTTARVPAMVISHGSGGVTDERENRWAKQINDFGIASFVVDSFTPRKILDTSDNQAQLSTAVNVADALSALRLLATHPQIDPQRIGIMGFSKGGQVAIYTALEPFRRAIVKDDLRFAAHAPFYPYCNDWYMSEHVTGAPMLFLLGALDDYTQAAPCRDYAAWFKSKGVDVITTIYPNAYHEFESGKPKAFFNRLVTGRNCNMAVDLDTFTVKLRASGEDITKTAQTYGRVCQNSRGATMSSDAEARRRSPEDLQAFLKAAFKM
jgi:dienelactone hydrolase